MYYKFFDIFLRRVVLWGPRFAKSKSLWTILELTTSLGLIDDFEIRYVEGISRLEALSRGQLENIALLWHVVNQYNEELIVTSL